MAFSIQRLDIDNAAQVSACYRVFACLRPHLNEQQFATRITRQASEGYRIVYIELGGEVLAAMGYREAHFLAWGKVLYIDDLVTHPDAKRQGCGGALLDWAVSTARELACDQVHLDTGHQRHDAHRLYLNRGFTLSSHHMSLKLSSVNG